jgi:toxin ParE1/3/4
MLPFRGILSSDHMDYMTLEVIFSRLAKHDIDAGYKWYERNQAGLGVKFLHAVDQCIATIVQNPLGFQRIEKDYRRAVTPRFPFAILYEYDVEITVYGVFNCRQDPYKWRERLLS